MRSKYVIPLAILLTTLITGCSKAEEEEIVEQPVVHLHQQADTTVWNDKTVNAITPCCAFDSSAEKLLVYPYYDSDMAVQVEQLLLSEDNKFWEAITKEYSNTDNLITKEKYSLVTLDNGNTIGIIELEDSMCYWVTSTELPSAYVQAVLNQLCQ